MTCFCYKPSDTGVNVAKGFCFVLFVCLFVFWASCTDPHILITYIYFLYFSTLEIGIKALVLTRSPDNVYDDVCEIIPELRSCEPGKLRCEG